MSKDFRLTSLLLKYPTLKFLIYNNTLPVYVSAIAENLEKNTLFVTFIAASTEKQRFALTFTLYFTVNMKSRVLTCTRLRVNAGTTVTWFQNITQDITPDTLLHIARALLSFHRCIAQVVLNPAPATASNSVARLLKKIVASSKNLSAAALSRSLCRAMVKTKPLTSHIVLKIPFSRDAETLPALMITFASSVIVSRLDLLICVRQKLLKS